MSSCSARHEDISPTLLFSLKSRPDVSQSNNPFRKDMFEVINTMIGEMRTRFEHQKPELLACSTLMPNTRLKNNFSVFKMHQNSSTARNNAKKILGAHSRRGQPPSAPIPSCAARSLCDQKSDRSSGEGTIAQPNISPPGF
jgi:hypothetical protein